MGGTPLMYPGFCFTRIMDFLCYMWVPEQMPPQQSEYEGSSIDENYFEGMPIMSEYSSTDYLNPLLGNLTWNKTADYGFGNMEFSAEDFYNQNIGMGGDLERQAANRLLMFLPPFLLAFGTAGNIFSMLVLLKLSANVLSSFYYLAVLTILDLIILYIRCGNLWVHAISGLDISNLLVYCSEAACKVYPFAFNCVFHMSRWLVVCTAIEGFIGTKIPEKASKLCNHERARGIMWLITVLLIWVNIHYFWSFERLSLKEGKMIVAYTCTFATQLTHEGPMHQHSEEFQQIIWPIMELLVGELIPFLVVLVCGMTMLMRLIHGEEHRTSRHQTWRLKYGLNQTAHDETYKMITALCVAYLIFTVPKSIYTVFKYLLETKRILVSQNIVDLENKVILAQGIFSIVDGCFHSLKIVVYFSSSAIFRKELLYFLRCCKYTEPEPARLRENHLEVRCLTDSELGEPQQEPLEQAATQQGAPRSVICTTI